LEEGQAGQAVSASSIIPTLEEKAVAETVSSDSQVGRSALLEAAKKSGHPSEYDETPHIAPKPSSKTWTLPTPAPHVDPYGFDDPISEQFWKNMLVACAVHNTEIYRKVFRAVPDDIITTWKQYKEFVAHHERLSKPVSDANHEPAALIPSEVSDEAAIRAAKFEDISRSEVKDISVDGSVRKSLSGSPSHALSERDVKDTKKTGKVSEPFDLSEREEMERLLGELRGHLVIYPTRFLESEDIANNFLFNADRLLPFFIYD